MKYLSLLAILAILAITANAIALPEADPYKYKFTWPGRKIGRCKSLGQGCWRVKCSAATFAIALTKDDLVVDRDSPQALNSHARSGAAFQAERALDELADVVAFSQDDPFFYYGVLDIGNHLVADTPGTETFPRRALKAEWVWCNGKFIG
ncbi:hypothetical protein COL516b_001373 [Colletotrichum fioriniae]|nr:uncharacterized protein COL516b_001373 [Colletotrichum fioriniae]KAJ0312298.1 hypothetical protein COL516b_001373 [Colletotrichum fioriniae]